LHEYRRRVRLGTVSVVLSVLVVLVAACGVGTTPTPSPDPSIAAAIETRARNGLRADRAWVEEIEADPGSVERWGIKVSPNEAARIDADELRDAIDERGRLGLRADEAWIRQVLADPSSVDRMGIRVTLDEAAVLDKKVDAVENLIGTVTDYGREHPEDWAGRYLDAAGVVHVQVTANAEEHEQAIEALFAGLVDIVVEEVRWTPDELDEFRERVRAVEFQVWLAERGISLEAYGIAERQNRVDIEVRTEPTDRDIDELILDHLNAHEWLIIHVDVVPPPIDLPSGSLTVHLVALDGTPVADGRLVLRPYLDVRYENESSAICILDERSPGVCRWSSIPATTYTVEAWRGYQRGFLGSGRVVVPAGGEEELTIVVNTSG